MFDRIKAILNKPELAAAGATGSIPDWARSAGLKCVAKGAGSYLIDGSFAGQPWAIEIGPSTRDFIVGQQLRGKVGLTADPNVSVIVMSRDLKESLDERVFKLYTDSVQTVVSPEMQDEMRWVTIFEEFGWDGLPPEFWQRYSVMADRRPHASVLVNEQLCEVLMNWPEQDAGKATPFTLQFSRSKLYLRMGFQPADVSTVQHAAVVLLSACEVAAAGFPVPTA